VQETQGDKARDPTAIPSDLLFAAAGRAGGGIAIVMGAGCSHDAPTSLPLSGELSLEIHKCLVTDKVIQPDAVLDPTDLSQLTDLVFLKTGSQEQIVRRFPVPRFRQATPNDGYLVIAAMMREGIINVALTLNFDLAMSTALAELGATDVRIVPGPEQHDLFSPPCLVYLHRNVDAGPDELILRTDVLEKEWEGKWRESIVQAIATSPNIVFAGLGTASPLFSQTLARVRATLPKGGHVFLVDILDHAKSSFAAELHIDTDCYVKKAWHRFTHELDKRALDGQIGLLIAAARQLCAEQGFPEEPLAQVLANISERGIVAMGKLRAMWLMLDRRYEPDAEQYRLFVADLLLGISIMEQELSGHATFDAEGLAWIITDTKRIGPVIVASGCGVSRWSSLEAKLLDRRDRYAMGQFAAKALVSGTCGGRPVLGPPLNVFRGDASSENLISGANAFEIITIDELRADRSLARRIAS
jgi:hypothetical protein